MFQVLCGGCFQIDEDFDSHESLRLFAATKFGLEYEPEEGAMVRQLSEVEFEAWFRRTLERRGWPIYKYGRGKMISRCLRLDEDGELSWGSKKKNNGQKKTTISLSEVREVVREPAPDAPAGTNPEAMICFIVNDGTGLKVLCTKVIDAFLLTYGFKKILEKAPSPAPSQL